MTKNAPPLKRPRRPTPPSQIVRRISEPTLDDHLALITRAVFQAGLSWAIIAAQWSAFETAYNDFDIRRVAAYDGFEVERLMNTPGIIHSAKKITGTIHNAQMLIDVAMRFGSVAAYTGSFPGYVDLLADARKRFAFFGDVSCYYWLFRSGNVVPRFEAWIAGQSADHPRVREMVFASRDAGTSTERDGY